LFNPNNVVLINAARVRSCFNISFFKTRFEDPYSASSHTLQKPITPKNPIRKKRKKPKKPKLTIKLVRSSHSIKNLTNAGKPLKIKIATQIKKEIIGTNRDKPPKRIRFLELNCF